MGIQINGQTDSISAIDGSLTVSGADLGSASAGSLNISGIVTASGFSGNVTGNINAAGVSTFSGGVVVSAGSTSEPSIRPTGDSNTGIFFPSPDTVCIGEGGTEVLRVDSNGRLGIGSATPGFQLTVDQGTTDGNLFDLKNEEVRLLTGVWGTGSTYPREITLNATRFDSGSVPYLRLAGQGGIKFAVDLNTQRMELNSNGDLLLGTTSTGAQIEIDTDNSFAGGDTGCGIRLYHTNSSLGSNNSLLGLNCATSGSSAYRMAQFNSGTTRSGFGDAEFVFYGNGTANADGSWNGGGADYAEYFEWSDGNVNDEDRRGISVVLDGNKIREALVGEDPIGVISGNPSMVGDAAWNKWSGKYLRDDYGSYILDEDGYRQLNPDFNPDEEYIPRDQRSEWDCVGLMGKLRIRKGQVTGSRWIKMRDVSDNIEEWLVR